MINIRKIDVILNEELNQKEMKKDLIKDNIHIPKKHVIIDESNDVITTYSLLSGNIGKIIDIKCPPGNIIIIKGTSQLYKNENRKDAHQLVLRLADKNNTEIDRSIQVSAKLIESFGEEKLVWKDSYGQFSPLKEDKTNKKYDEFFRLHQSVVIQEGYILRIYLKNPNIDIDYEHILLNIDTDILKIN